VSDVKASELILTGCSAICLRRDRHVASDPRHAWRSPSSIEGRAKSDFMHVKWSIGVCPTYLFAGCAGRHAWVNGRNHGTVSTSTGEVDLAGWVDDSAEWPARGMSTRCPQGVTDFGGCGSVTNAAVRAPRPRVVPAKADSRARGVGFAVTFLGRGLTVGGTGELAECLDVWRRVLLLLPSCPQVARIRCVGRPDPSTLARPRTRRLRRSAPPRR
jgi:hypothetical protein